MATICQKPSQKFIYTSSFRTFNILHDFWNCFFSSAKETKVSCNCKTRHCVKSVQMRGYLWSVFSRIWTEYANTVFSPNAGKYGPEITPYLDTFRAVKVIPNYWLKVVLIRRFRKFNRNVARKKRWKNCVIFTNKVFIVLVHVCIKITNYIRACQINILFVKVYVYNFKKVTLIRRSIFK